MSSGVENNRTVVLSPGGSRRREVPLNQIVVPDCWQIAERLKEMGMSEEAEKVLQTWHLAHDLKRNLEGLQDE